LAASRRVGWKLLLRRAGRGRGGCLLLLLRLLLLRMRSLLGGR
jgi:hypothetical protein